MKESGEIVQGLQSGVIQKTDIRADLFKLCRGECTDRENETSITLFKSVGSALEDLVAAQLALRAAEKC